MGGALRVQDSRSVDPGRPVRACRVCRRGRAVGTSPRHTARRRPELDRGVCVVGAYGNAPLVRAAHFLQSQRIVDPEQCIVRRHKLRPGIESRHRCFPRYGMFNVSCWVADNAIVLILGFDSPR